jgi:3-dehydroquinate synthase
VRVSVKTSASYPVHATSLDKFASHISAERLPPGSVIILSDENVWNIHGDGLWNLCRSYWDRSTAMVIEPGEQSKSLEQLQRIYDRAFEFGIDRNTVIVAAGGGVIGDLAGYAAATLMRGLPLVHIPTSVIAQVDSSIGGKTGINHPAGKNLIGAFHTPRAVLTDPAFLRTLPEREFASGLAEVVKHALISDAGFGEWLSRQWDAIMQREDETLLTMVKRAAAVKVRVVEDDVLEHGHRAILNFGHTFGHAIEKVAGYGAFTHGEAVAVGMKAAVHLSSMLYPSLDADFALTLIDRIPIVPDPSDLAAGALIDAMRLDKKSRSGQLRFVCLEEIGKAVIVDGVDEAFVASAIERAKTA